MKTLTKKEILAIVSDCCNNSNAESCEKTCPLFKEYYYCYTGEPCGSILETFDKSENDC